MDNSEAKTYLYRCWGLLGFVEANDSGVFKMERLWEFAILLFKPQRVFAEVWEQSECIMLIVHDGQEGTDMHALTWDPKEEALKGRGKCCGITIGHLNHCLRICCASASDFHHLSNSTMIKGIYLTSLRTIPPRLCAINTSGLGIALWPVLLIADSATLKVDATSSIFWKLLFWTRCES
jgi:hypothetical protein